MAIFQVDLG